MSLDTASSPPHLSSTKAPAILAPLGLIAVLVVTAIVYWPALHAQFTNWDDDLHLTANPLFDPPMVHGVGRVWAKGFLGLYIPVSYTVWMVLGYVTMPAMPIGADRYLRPEVFHAANIVVHLLATAAVWLLLRRLLRRANERADSAATIAATLGALVFALHPLQVETVAWVSGFRDALAGCFGVIAVWQYIAYVQAERPDAASGPVPRRGLHYAAMVLACAAAMLSKPNAAALPLVLLALDVCWLRRPIRAALATVAPVIALAVPYVIVSRIAQPATHLAPVAWFVRPIVALDALGFYLAKLFVPLRLIPDYGRTPARIMHWPALWTVALLLLAAGGWWWTWRRLKPSVAPGAAGVPRRIAAGLIVAIVALTPVLGLVSFDFQDKSTVADRYVYLAMLGIAAAAAAIVDAALRRGPATRGAAIVLSGAILLILAATSRGQIALWHDSGTLWRHQLRINPDSWIGQNNLACVEFAQHDYTQAERRLRRAIELNPKDMAAYVNLGSVLAAESRLPESLRVYRDAVNQWPQESETHAGLAAALLQTQDLRGAADEYTLAIHATSGTPNYNAEAMYQYVIDKLRQPPTTRPTSQPATGPAPPPSPIKPLSEP